MTIRVRGFHEFATQLFDWADDLDDPEFDPAIDRAVSKAAVEMLDEARDNVSKIPHNLTKLRRSLKAEFVKPGRADVYTRKEYAPAFEFGSGPYLIEGNPLLAVDTEDWDNQMAKERLVEEYYGQNTDLSDVDTFYFPRVQHPGFEAYFYFTKAFLEMAEGGRFEDILEEEVLEDELEEAWS